MVVCSHQVTYLEMIYLVVEKGFHLNQPLLSESEILFKFRI